MFYNNIMHILAECIHHVDIRTNIPANPAPSWPLWRHTPASGLCCSLPDAGCSGTSSVPGRPAPGCVYSTTGPCLSGHHLHSQVLSPRHPWCIHPRDVPERWSTRKRHTAPQPRLKVWYGCMWNVSLLRRCTILASSTFGIPEEKTKLHCVSYTV